MIKKSNFYELNRVKVDCIEFPIKQFPLIAVSGNANYRMSQTSFTMVGFTQPRAALPIIEDAQNTAKGFMSRILMAIPRTSVL